MKPSVATKWNSQVRTVLCPAYLDDVRLDSNSDLGSRQAVSRHAEEVEEARRSRHQKPGTRTLQDTATEFLVANLSSLSTASLSTLPSHLVLRLWSAVVQRGLLTFDAWRMFTRLLSKDKHLHLAHLRYRQAVHNPDLQIATYIDSLNSPSFRWITVLSITAPFSMTDFVKLSTFKNLGVLEIAAPYSTVTPPGDPRTAYADVGDRLIRTWSEAAKAEDAFCVLRVLIFNGQPSITEKCVPYLTEFPALTIFCAQRCGDMRSIQRTATKLGWSSWKYLEADEIVPLVAKECIKSHGKASPLAAPRCDPLWDGSRVFQLNRSLVPKYLSSINLPGDLEPGNAVLSSSFEDDNEQDAAVNAWRKKTKEDIDNVPQSADLALFLKTKGIKTWDFQNYALFNLVGGLFNDKDFETVGIRSKHQAIVGDAVVSSVPVAVIRLGPLISDPKSLDSAYLYSSDERRDEANSGIMIRVVRSPAVSTISATGSRSTKVVPDKPNKRPAGRTVKNSKKQKLESMLGLFG